MSGSNYPNGFSNGVTIRGVPITIAQPGQVFWVNNSSVLPLNGIGGSDGNDGSYLRPFSTLDYAVGKCTANRGDTIMVMPGHAETYSTATSLNLDVAGIAIVGLGSGNKRPTFTLDTATTTTIPVTAANISIKNCVFTANFADVASFFTTTTAKNLALEDCYFKATATNMNATYIVDTNTTTNDTDGLYIVGCTWVEPDLATIALTKVDGINDRWTIKNNYFSLGVNNNKGLVNCTTGKYITNLNMGGNVLYRLNTDSATGALLYNSDTASGSGLIYDNQVQHADTAAELLVTASGTIGTFQNFASGVVGASGYLLPAADA